MKQIPPSGNGAKRRIVSGNITAPAAARIVGSLDAATPRAHLCGNRGVPGMDDQTRTELEAAAFRRLLAHLQKRTDVQNIDMMNLTGLWRYCLSGLYDEAAAERGLPVDLEAARELVYGMPYDDWRALHQTDADDAQQAAFKTAFAENVDTPKG